jgi:hypothetical protein
LLCRFCADLSGLVGRRLCAAPCHRNGRKRLGEAL